MGDAIDLENGELWGGASWLVRNVLAGIAEVISEDGSDPKLAKWLNDCSERANGMAGFDLRGLSEQRRGRFFAAATRALDRARAKGSESWNMPEAFDGYIQSFELLVNRTGSPYYDGTTDWDGTKIDLDDLWNSEEA